MHGRIMWFVMVIGLKRSWARRRGDVSKLNVE